MKARGFTLIELMVALTGGLVFTVFVFMLTRDATRFFQRETRLADTTLGAIAGFERLRADVARAGFLSSPNLAKDPSRCPRGLPGNLLSGLDANGWPDNLGLRQMGLLQIDVGGSPSGTEQSNNSLDPDSLTLYGNYTSTEQFPIRTIQQSGAAYDVYLESRSGALMRVGYVDGGNAADNAAILGRFFPTGRALRLVTQEGEEQYGIIAGIRVEGAPIVQLSNAIRLTFKASSGTTCGFRGLSSTVQANPVNIVRYELRNMNDPGTYPGFANLFSGARPVTDTGRMDLVRYELLPDGTTEANHEIVAEYAVDLKFGISVSSVINPPVITYYPEDNENIVNFASNPLVSPANTAGRGPHLIRGVHARLAVRAVEPDRQAGITPTNAIGPGLYRVSLGTGQFARVRTLQAMIATRNARNKQWN